MEQEGRIAEARIQAKNTIKLDPNHTGAYLLLGRCAIKEQNWREAFGSFQRAVELDPENVEGLLGVGRLYLLSGEIEKVEEISGKILSIEPASLEAKLLRIGGLLQRKNFEEAHTQIKEVLVTEPSNEDALIALSVIHEQQNRPDQALATIDQGLSLHPESKALLFRAANLAMAAEQLQVAEKHLLKLKELAPDNHGVSLILAGLYERMEDLPKVENILRDMVRTEPDSEEIRLRLAEYLVRTGKPEEALTLIAEAPEGPTPKLRLGMAAIHAQTGELDETQKILTDLAADTTAGPAAVDARLQLAELKLLQGDREGSLAEANEVLRQDPANARGHALRGRLYTILGRAEEALSELRIARHDSPEDMGLAVLTARAHFTLGNALLGVEELRSFLAKKPDAMPVRMELAAHYQRQQQSDTALTVLKDGLNHGNAMQLLVGMGDIETSRKQYDAAEKYYRQAADQAKGQEFPLLRLGALQAERKNFSAARQTFIDLLQANPDAHGAAEGLVALDVAENHPEKALEWAKQRSETRPEDALAADLLGRTALNLKKVDMAEEAFREAQRRAPNWAVPSARLAGLYISTGRKDAALAESRAALERNPESIPEALLLGQLLQLSGEKAEAEATYRGLLKRRPDLLPAANNLAYLLVSAESPTAEQLSEAMALATKASASGDPATQDTLAWVHYRLGDKDKALEILQQVHLLLPEDPSVTYHLAQVLADKGRTEEAKTLLKQVVDKEKVFPEAAAAQQLLEKL